MRSSIWLRTSALAAAVALSAGCLHADADEPVAHVHGLGLDKGNVLYVATHHGLFRLPPGRSELERVGEHRYDLMGFTTVTTNWFIASGHPGPDDRDAPPLLGLVRSRDGGKTWRSVSLSGEADFHVLRAYGREIYGFDVAGERLLTSGDNGQTWRELRAPEPNLVDLVRDGDEPNRLIASGERSLHISTDGGRTWRPIGVPPALLAQPAGVYMWAFDGSGAIWRSEDGRGRRWRPVGSLAAPPVALTGGGSPGDANFWVALEDGRIVHSDDGARSWPTVVELAR